MKPGPLTLRGEPGSGKRDARARCRAVEVIGTKGSGFLFIFCVEQ